MKKWFRKIGVVFLFLGAVTAQAQPAQIEEPYAMMQRLSNEVLDILKNDQRVRAGDVAYIQGVVNEKIMPHINFLRMTAMTVGPAWREATPEQKQKLQDELEMMLIRTYSGALDQVSPDCQVNMRPFRGSPQDTDVTLNSEVRCASNPVELSYRLRLEKEGWKIYNVNVAGVWMVENYRSQFQPQINSGGIQGLIDALSAHNEELKKKNNQK